MMGSGHAFLRKKSDLQFYQLMGTGGGDGFAWYPDLSTYTLFTLWPDPYKATDFIWNSEFFDRYRKYADEVYTVWLNPLEAKGYWDQQELVSTPYEKDPQLPIAVITRAAIKLRYVMSFWKEVPRVSEKLRGSEGLIFAKSMGELPLIRQATFSLWKNEEAMEAYAYKAAEHQKVIKMTHQKQWYKEEMFARFQPFASEGSFNGSNPLQPFLEANKV